MSCACKITKKPSLLFERIVGFTENSEKTP